MKEETTLFGVSLNLSAIERSVRTPEEIKQERNETASGWAALYGSPEETGGGRD